MDGSSEKGKKYRSEMRLYECLGIKVFRKMVLKLETLRHRRDHGRNRNYHLRDGSISVLQAFPGYLLYNALIHIGSILFVAVCFFFSPAVEIRIPGLGFGAGALIAANVYCIMLQRYTYLKLQAYAEVRIKNRSAVVDEKTELLRRTVEGRASGELQEEFELLNRLRDSVQNGTDCFLAGADEGILRRIEERSEGILGQKRRLVSDDKHCDTFMHMMRELPEPPFVIASIERRVARLQRGFGMNRRNNLLFAYSVITETRECENIYRRIFPGNTRDSVELKLDVLTGAYQKVLFPGGSEGVR